MIGKISFLIINQNLVPLNMEKFSVAVDDYIAKSEAFAQPILEYWRKAVHQVCPEVVEAIKWGYPHFDYKRDFMFVISAYKAHCTFTFVKAELMSDPRLKESKQVKPAQRFLGKITKMSDLPTEEAFFALLAEAMELNEKGLTVPTKKTEKPAVLETPDDLAKRLADNPQAKEIFENKSNSFRKEYIVWITEAKTEATRNKRLDEAMTWIEEGKSRYWKFKK